MHKTTLFKKYGKYVLYFGSDFLFFLVAREEAQIRDLSVYQIFIMYDFNTIWNFITFTCFIDTFIFALYEKIKHDTGTGIQSFSQAESDKS